MKGPKYQVIEGKRRRIYCGCDKEFDMEKHTCETTGSCQNCGFYY